MNFTRDTLIRHCREDLERHQIGFAPLSVAGVSLREAFLEEVDANLRLRMERGSHFEPPRRGYVLEKVRNVKLQAELDRARAEIEDLKKNKNQGGPATLGVGHGLFVHGSYEAVKVAQKLIDKGAQNHVKLAALEVEKAAMLEGLSRDPGCGCDFELPNFRSCAHHSANVVKAIQTHNFPGAFVLQKLKNISSGHYHDSASSMAAEALEVLGLKGSE